MVETHRDCLDVIIIENIVKDVKKSEIFNEIEELNLLTSSLNCDIQCILHIVLLRNLDTKLLMA
jgi:hypothetical protein